VGDQLDEGLESNYFTREQHAEMIMYVKRACAANTGLRRYLTAEIARRKSTQIRRSLAPKGPKVATPRRGPTDPRT